MKDNRDIDMQGIQIVNKKCKEEGINRIEYLSKGRYYANEMDNYEAEEEENVLSSKYANACNHM